MPIKYVKDHIPKGTACNRRPALLMSATSITIHNTGNPSSTAKNERAWLTNMTNNRTASFHIVVDEHGAIECLPINENGWHAGDGSGTASGNRTSIGIELCESGNYAKILDNAVELVAIMLKERGWGVDRLRRHYDWSGKICPRLMHDDGKWTGWTEFKARVACVLQPIFNQEEQSMTNVEQVEFDKLQKQVRGLVTELSNVKKELVKHTNLMPTPVWFVKEFGSVDLDGKILDPRLTEQGWRGLAIAQRLMSQ
ncbi:N-acetylmuramoyl-L-alanine amidase family protein [Paenibacillus sp. 2TAB23]|uniref:peptidoglycan recognition protein family protein n=1 Tax=Paenibacillus sp. 2TAB23 TaxID=3233004 RepID=UPI003F9457BE